MLGRCRCSCKMSGWEREGEGQGRGGEFMICGFLDGEGGMAKGGRYAEGSRFRGG